MTPEEVLKQARQNYEAAQKVKMDLLTERREKIEAVNAEFSDPLKEAEADLISSVIALRRAEDEAVPDSPREGEIVILIETGGMFRSVKPHEIARGIIETYRHGTHRGQIGKYDRINATPGCEIVRRFKKDGTPGKKLSFLHPAKLGQKWVSEVEAERIVKEGSSS